MSYEKSAFVSCLGDTPYVRVLDYFLSNHTFDCSVQDISEYSELARNTVKGIVDEMLQLGLIERTRAMGRAILYQLNTEHEEVKLLLDFEFKLNSLKALEAEEEAQQKVKVPQRR